MEPELVTTIDSNLGCKSAHPFLCVMNAMLLTKYKLSRFRSHDVAIRLRLSYPTDPVPPSYRNILLAINPPRVTVNAHSIEFDVEIIFSFQQSLRVRHTL
jgi:hypothetical protein